jgi:hypothetical protein
VLTFVETLACGHRRATVLMKGSAQRVAENRSKAVNSIVRSAAMVSTSYFRFGERFPVAGGQQVWRAVNLVSAPLLG